MDNKIVEAYKQQLWDLVRDVLKMLLRRDPNEQEVQQAKLYHSEFLDKYRTELHFRGHQLGFIEVEYSHDIPMCTTMSFIPSLATHQDLSKPN